jgi:hypothetical protein
MNYADSPGGKIGEVVAGAMWNPERDLREDLEDFARRGELEQGGPHAQAQSRSGNSTLGKFPI